MLRNCNECDKVFSHPNNKLCPECVRKRNAQFTLVKDYLRTHPNAIVREVVTETRVSVERVKEFIKEGRLRVIPADYHHKCHLCGAKISSGKICSRCKLDLRDTKKTNVKSKDHDKEKDAKMHLLDAKRIKKLDGD